MTNHEIYHPNILKIAMYIPSKKNTKTKKNINNKLQFLNFLDILVPLDMIIMIRYRLRGLSRSVHEQGSTSVVPRGDFLGDEGGIKKAQVFWKIVWICRQIYGTTRQCDGLSTFQGQFQTPIFIE